MRNVFAVWLLLVTTSIGAADRPKALVTGLRAPSSVVVGLGGKVYIAERGQPGKTAGAIRLLEDGKTKVIVSHCHPLAIAHHQGTIYFIEEQRVFSFGKQNKTVFVDTDDFPSKPGKLRDIAVEQRSGKVYVTGSDAIFCITPAKPKSGKKPAVSIVLDRKRWPEWKKPAAIELDGHVHLLVADEETGTLHRLNLVKRTVEKVAEGLGAPTALCWDMFGRLFVGDGSAGKILVIPRPGEKPVVMADRLQGIADFCLAPQYDRLLVPNRLSGELVSVPINVPGFEVDMRPLPVATELAFPKLKWTGWKPVTDAGKPIPLRPIVLTHAGDGSNRVFVATQRGVIHVFPNHPNAEKTSIFLDLQDRVTYSDNTNEEGFLGLAFHPRYKENGQFFVFYTVKKPKLTNVLARFRVRKDDPNRADPNSEEILLRVKRPFWNHDGGTIAFGPDGFLYIALGDGGSANDPFGNGQNLKTLLGAILRIDVDHQQTGKPYAIPKDNPFLDVKDACPEIWAYGLRNVWRMAFDRKTGRLWAGEVGQNLYEEINIITRGGNYGWNLREALHPFGADGVGPRPDLIDPIWEYHHDVGKSITGGLVYRGQRVPQLQGGYLYADYISAKIWALWYDDAKKRTVANRPIRDPNVPVLSFGEDETGEAYLLTYTNTGQGIYRFVSTK
ncbi:MAG: hypothetical protein KatS3mg105_0511 [Gemmatales bacterium]|nr:MAG: hypothetical protein KatS3mg105_0511 [Gemmatales bacterium]